MKARRIDMFFMRYYDEYCSNKVVFNEPTVKSLQ